MFKLNIELRIWFCFCFPPVLFVCMHTHVHYIPELMNMNLNSLNHSLWEKVIYIIKVVYLAASLSKRLNKLWRQKKKKTKDYGFSIIEQKEEEVIPKTKGNRFGVAMSGWFDSLFFLHID